MAGSQDRNAGNTASGRTGRSRPADARNIGRANRDILMLGIMAAAILLFTATGSSVLTDLARRMMGHPAKLDPMLSSALILNIALIIFGWRRYAELTREVSERRKAEETAFNLAQTDPLTGCLNRRNLHISTGELIRAARNRGRTVVMMMLDLDMFKRINDIYGHQTGDAVLVESTRRLRKLLPEDALLARLGGDEFACVLEMEPDRPEAVDALATRIIEDLAAPIHVVTPSVEVTASIGLARAEALSCQPVEDCAEELLHMADLAMYQAKKRGRNCFVWFESGMAREMKYRSELERGIRDGIAAGEFVPYYERQVDIETGRITGFEMLARWVSPKYGLVSPEVFIPIAEEMGLISELSEVLIAQALRDAHDWDPDLSLSVNISPLQLRDPWFAQKLLKLLLEANFPPSRLEIEITETCLHENIGVVRSLVTSLKNQGVSVSLDDFGTGYSSLAQLRTLPFDRIKIDRSFIMSLGDNPDSETIVRAITSLGAGMNLPIVAEGIESTAIADQLKTLGRFKGQGFLYGKPATAAEIRSLMAGNRQPDPVKVSPRREEVDEAAATDTGKALPQARRA
ncbi:EAL domain-containing protein [Novosphingobium sp. ZN18A2]|uniref:putative bifunctional diguanylate cyclase/phosphodiesterase n=1 Tax=Novosphingobium sp. ZN18A2 TaxID=3079861 RepID=UPI0030D3BDD2